MPTLRRSIALSTDRKTRRSSVSTSSPACMTAWPSASTGRPSPRPLDPTHGAQRARKPALRVMANGQRNYWRSCASASYAGAATMPQGCLAVGTRPGFKLRHYREGAISDLQTGVILTSTIRTDSRPTIVSAVRRGEPTPRRAVQRAAWTALSSQLSLGDE
jgi:hypothetical protein